MHMKSDGGLARLEFLSDGVFAIAMTLLVLEIKAPHVHGDVAPAVFFGALVKLWPSLIAMVASFWVIFVMWVNHRRFLSVVEHSSTAFDFANGFVLLLVAFIPFPTALLAEHLATPSANYAVVVYALYRVVTNIAFMLLWEAARRPVNLLSSSFDEASFARVRDSIRMGAPIYLAIALMAWWLPLPALFVIVGLNIYWASGSMMGARR